MNKQNLPQPPFDNDSLHFDHFHSLIFNSQPSLEQHLSFNPDHLHSQQLPKSSNKEQSTKNKQRNRKDRAYRVNPSTIEQQKQTTVEFYQIYELYSYLQELIFVSSSDPMLSIFSTFYGNCQEDSVQDEKNFTEKEIKFQNSSLKEQLSSPFDSWFDELKEKNRYYQNQLQNYSKITKNNPEQSQLATERKNQTQKRIIGSVWDLIHHQFKYLSNRQLQTFINFRDLVERVKQKLQRLEKLSGSFEKIEAENSKKSVCKICWEIFDHGKMLGGHVAKKHPGFSKLYKVRQYLCKIKNEEKKRRMYFKGMKRLKKQVCESVEGEDIFEECDVEDFFQKQ